MSDVRYQVLGFAAGADPPTLLARLAAVPGMAPEPDADGNLQSRYRLDLVAGTPPSYVLTFPQSVDAAAVQAVINGCPTISTLASQLAARVVAGAWVQLRLIRDRWLAQTDYIESFVNDPGSFAHLPQPIKDAISANSAGWVTWRQGLRDLPNMPGAPGINPVAAVMAVGSVHSTGDSFPAPWPQPPAAPVVHLT